MTEIKETHVDNKTTSPDKVSVFFLLLSMQSKFLYRCENSVVFDNVVVYKNVQVLGFNS